MTDSCIIRLGACLIIAICFIVCMVTPKLRRYVRWYSGFTGGGHISRLSCAVLALDALLWGVKFWSDCIHYPLFSQSHDLDVVIEHSDTDSCHVVI